MAKIEFGGVMEEVITSEEFTLEKARGILENEVVAVIGYGVQGPGQALNMRDNGIQVIVGQRQGGASWDRAVADGFVPGKTLFPIEEAARKATVIQYLLSDAGQVAMWPKIKACLNDGDALYFSHGFGVVYKDQTGIVPPENVDVILAAPKGSGRTVRTNFLDGSGINSSFAVFQDYTGRARERCLAMGIAIGSGYLFETTFEKEVLSDLTGETGRSDGMPGRRHGGPVQPPPKTRPQPQRILQRNRGGADPEPDPAGGGKRHGLDVRQLQHHGPAGCSGLGATIPRRRGPRLRPALRECQKRRGDPAGAGSQQRPGLP